MTDKEISIGTFEFHVNHYDLEFWVCVVVYGIIPYSTEVLPL